MMLVSEFINQNEEAGSIPLYIGVRGSINYIKAVFYVSTTEVRFVHTGSSNTDYAIPLYIIGVK